MPFLCLYGSYRASDQQEVTNHRGLSPSMFLLAVLVRLSGRASSAKVCLKVTPSRHLVLQKISSHEAAFTASESHCTAPGDNKEIYEFDHYQIVA